MTDDYTPPGSEPWVVALGVDPDGDVVIQALSENTDLDDVDALEHRFYAVVPEADHTDEGPTLVYAGVMVHYCKSDEDADCELYAPDGPTLDPNDLSRDGRASLDDLPATIRERVSDALGLRLVEPRDLDHAYATAGPEAFDMFPGGTPDHADRGFW